MKIRKYASGQFNSPSLPGQMFETKEGLLKAAWPYSRMHGPAGRSKITEEEMGDYAASQNPGLMDFQGKEIPQKSPEEWAKQVRERGVSVLRFVPMAMREQVLRLSRQPSVH